ncbi:MAG: HD domain-containing protein [Gammaproteobacteria bacterium]|nr:MAG: HD domain-containing protein [Gammaproteobacteria bacterium]
MNAATPPPSRHLPALFGLLLLFAMGLWGVHRYVTYERSRDLAHWHQRLDLLADDRLDRVQHWLEGQRGLLDELAHNAAVRLYLVQAQGGTRQAEEASIAQAAVGYLRNYLAALADRAGIGASSPPAVPANLPRRSAEGLALFDRDGRLVVATPGFPAPTDQDRALLRRVARHDRSALRDVRLLQGRPVVGFLVPVPPPSGAGSRPVGAAYLLRDLGNGLYPRLHPRTQRPFDSTLLVERRQDQIVFLSPQADGTPPLRRALSPDQADQAAVEAVTHPGHFALRRDATGRAVLMTSRAVPGTPWILVQQTLADTALHDSRRHARFLYLTFSLALLLAVAAILAAWRHGSSVRARRLAAELAEKNRLLSRQHHLLNAITDHVDDLLLLLDEEQRIRFANRPLAQRLGVRPEELAGTHLAAALGPETARRLSACLEESQSTEAGVRPCVLTLGGEEGHFLCHRSALPEDEAGNRLLVLHEVTALVQEQQRRQRLYDQLLAALMRAIDRHDPWSAGHSERTARVARAIAEEMQRPPAEIAALELAARLANVGKILVPREILTKAGPLTPEEQERLRQHVDHAVDILSQIDFEGPVVEIVAQKQEHLDGSGYPRGLRDGEILLPARILAVANAFVALVSPRAWRDAVGIEAALQRLLAQTPDKYDRQVVAALFHVAENVLRPEELLEARS